MTYNVYSVRNNVSGLHDGLFLFTCDEHASYELSRRIKPEQSEIMSVFNVGTFDIVTGELSPSPIKEISLVNLSNVDSLARKSEISHETAERQNSQFVEKISDIH